MATIVLSAAGMALGSSIGGSFLGLSSAVIGRAVGAVAGRLIDERLLGAGSVPVETGKVDRFRLTGASEGAPVSQVYGRMRMAGQVIWASQFLEQSSTSGGGKGRGSTGAVIEFSYSVSMAIALCAGPITRVGRIWADGVEVATDQLNMRVYDGSEDQQPDPKMEAVEGAGAVPAYRGIAYVVFEDLPLGPYGNRVPQFSFEVFRPAPRRPPEVAEDLAHLIRAVAMIPGTGEYALATSPGYLSGSFGERTPVNLNSPSGKTDFATSLQALTEELPQCASVSLVVSWFGDDLRCGSCTIRPKVEQAAQEAEAMPWQVSCLTRSTAQLVPRIDDRPVYGGTPSDRSVIEAIEAMHAAGQEVVYYPFILMDQLADNTLTDPWTGLVGQPPLPWRGRITGSLAPGLAGTPDRTAEAEAEVAAFFGTTQPGDFAPMAQEITYAGPDEWSLRRFILHQAHLCAAAGGVSAFCIGSEMRGLTQIRGVGDSFPAVAALRALAADVRTILGPECKIGYAADWSEYHGYQPQGTADKYFHLDPLWADPQIDFIGIDNYMPLSDWRDGDDHLDAGFGSIYNLDYLTGNVAGGEGFDWYYHSPEALEAQIRTPIRDGDGEPWVWRYKDLKGWWSNRHHDRIGGQRQATPTDWEPGSKPIWFTEIGCAAIDKGTNEPNKFLDPKSSESFLPRHSNGMRDDLIQMQYLRAIHRHFADPVANPASDLYDGRMVDMARTHVWAWDGRPFPAFPARSDVWSDGGNYARGHWLNGRSTARSLASVVAEICVRVGVQAIDTTELYGLVRGYRVDETETARAALQVLMLAYGFDAVERDGLLVFRTRDGKADGVVEAGHLAFDPGAEAVIERLRAPAAEVAGAVRVGFVDAEADYDLRSAEAVFPDDALASVTASELPLALLGSEGRRIAERWLAEARVARDTARFALPPSAKGYGAGDVVRIGSDGTQALWRIDRLDSASFQAIEAVRVEPETYRPHETADDTPGLKSFVPPVPVEAVFLDLPLLRGDEDPVAPHVAMTGRPWPGSVALYSAPQDEGYTLNTLFPVAATVGTTLTPLFRAQPGLWDRGPALRVQLVRGALTAATEAQVLAGLNMAAIGDGQSDLWEVFQFAWASLVGPDTWDLSLRLRGQAGSDGVMPVDWPAGSRFVLLDGAASQIALSSSARETAQHYRFGPAQRPLDDATYRYASRTFSSIGLRPYSVCHLMAERAANGDLALHWIRRTRIDGDSWTPAEVALGEAVERYRVEVWQGGTLLRSAEVGSPQWNYPTGMQSSDVPGGDVTVKVAQLSDRYGPGPAKELTLVLAE